MIVIKAENISKQYRLGQVGSKTMAADFKRWLYKLQGKEDPYAKIGETNDRSTKGSSEYVWALKDIDFEVKQGEVLGIIGKNGAGKSTLLKILSRVTTPTTGKISIHGRMASLLEVGTGFHPELTGRENVFLNGAIMGMSKAEIKSKFDEIVDFSGVERYIDTPVKRYSSGMHVRLGFAVAAHLEPEILVVDEVLAVGDAEFQKKCLGKMKTVSGEGRTVLFVSHNMGAIQSLCTSGIVMKNGTLDFAGNINDCVSQYLKMNSNSIEEDILLTEKGQGSGEALIKEIKLLNRTETNSNAVFYQSKIALKLKIESQVSSISINADVKICNKEGTVIFHALNLYYNQKLILEKGISYLLVEIENRLLPGFYIASIGIYNAHTLKTIDTHENILDFEVLKVSKIAKESYAFDWVVAPSILESNWQITNG